MAEQAQKPAQPRAFWSGTITFGLVSVPVDMFPAVRSTHTPLRMLSESGHPLARRYVCSEDGKRLEPEDIVRGYQVEDGAFVVIADEELERLAPEKSRDIDLRRFVPETSLDVRLLERPYVLAPSGSSTKAYHLLADTMERGQRAGIATFVMRGKAYIAAIFAKDGLLHAQTMRFVDELRSVEDVGLPPAHAGDAKAKKRLASALARLEKKGLDPELLRDDSGAELLKLAQAKYQAGRDVVEVAEEELEAGAGESENVIDIMALLKQRMGTGGEQARRSSSRPARAAKPTTKAGGATRAADDLTQRSKQELYRRAKALQIEGRSQMSKPELVRAIRAAS